MPPDDAPGEHVDNEGHLQPCLPGRHVGEVRDLELVRSLGAKPPVSGHSALPSLTVARTTLPRTMPVAPSPHRRSTMQRAIAIPSRTSCFQILSVPWTCKGNLHADQPAPIGNEMPSVSGFVPCCR